MTREKAVPGTEQYYRAERPEILAAAPLYSGTPVDWQPWSDQTFALARSLDKPILLSLGYSVCDWCLQMKRDSFADAETAAFMNAHFVCVGVERDIRPDIDAVYQTLHLLLSGRPGGWPLTLFMCPRTRLPFIAGTFYPQSAAGSEALDFPTILRKARDYYTEHLQDCKRLLVEVDSNLNELTGYLTSGAVSERSQVQNALQKLLAMADLRDGGFGSAPKFALPVNLGFLLRMASRTEVPDSQLQHLHLSLCLLSERGIHDRIGGGFFRYALDDSWHCPSYEKMLFDNGLLFEVYARAHLIFPRPEYQHTLLSTVDWLKRSMLAPEGVFYTAQGSGADGVEDYYYGFSGEQLRQHLDADQWRLCDALFGFQIGPQDRVHLSQIMPLAMAARDTGIDLADAQRLLRHAEHKLRQLQQERLPPRVDKTVVVSANAVIIRALAVAGRFDPALLPLADAALEFIVERMWVHQRLFSVWRDGSLGQHAYLEDYVFLIDALLELLQTRWRDQDYRLALVLAESLLALFQDTQRGGFFQTANDAETLVYRNKPYMDGTQPAANGVVARVLLRLGHLSAEPRFIHAAQRTLESASLLLRHAPDHHLGLVEAHAEFLQPVMRILILEGENNRHWQKEILQKYRDRVACFLLPGDAQYLPPDMLGLESGEAIVCAGEECSLACANLDDLFRRVDELFSRQNSIPVDCDSTPAVARGNQ